MATAFIDMRVKDLFFDRPKVRRAVDRATRRALSKSGAFIRQRARTSMRGRRGSSAPGSPPHAHEGSLRRLLFFAYDPAPGGGSVVVGPVGFRRSEAPNTLEFGGATTVTRRRVGRDGKRVVQSRRVRIEARPYMGPALRKELPNMPRAWAGSVRGGR